MKISEIQFVDDPDQWVRSVAAWNGYCQYPIMSDDCLRGQLREILPDLPIMANGKRLDRAKVLGMLMNKFSLKDTGKFTTVFGRLNKDQICSRFFNDRLNDKYSLIGANVRELPVPCLQGGGRCPVVDVKEKFVIFAHIFYYAEVPNRLNYKWREIERYVKVAAFCDGGNAEITPVKPFHEREMTGYLLYRDLPSFKYLYRGEKFRIPNSSSVHTVNYSWAAGGVLLSKDFKSVTNALIVTMAASTTTIYLVYPNVEYSGIYWDSDKISSPTAIFDALCVEFGINLSKTEPVVLQSTSVRVS